jgi:hypothetical protein
MYLYNNMYLKSNIHIIYGGNQEEIDTLFFVCCYLTFQIGKEILLLDL